MYIGLVFLITKAVIILSKAATIFSQMNKRHSRIQKGLLPENQCPSRTSSPLSLFDTIVVDIDDSQEHLLSPLPPALVHKSNPHQFLSISTSTRTGHGFPAPPKPSTSNPDRPPLRSIKEVKLSTLKLEAIYAIERIIAHFVKPAGVEWVWSNENLKKVVNRLTPRQLQIIVAVHHAFPDENAPFQGASRTKAFGEFVTSFSTKSVDPSMLAKVIEELCNIRQWELGFLDPLPQDVVEEFVTTLVSKKYFQFFSYTYMKKVAINEHWVSTQMRYNAVL
jgi:hypothetical protein